MRIVDPDGGWVEHPEEGRNMEFWDAVHHATGIKSSTNVWFFGPTVEQELAVCRWSDEHAPGSYVCTLVRIRPSAARSGHNTTINLIEGDRGDDDHTNSDVAITFDSKVGEGQRCNELVTIAAEEGE